MTTGSVGRKQRRCGLAWLAVVALLINALIPTSLTVAAARAQQTALPWCGSHPRSDWPAQQPADRLCDRCLLCVAPASTLGPPAPANLAASAPIAMAIARAVQPRAPLQRSCYRCEQPRGPPAAAAA